MLAGEEKREEREEGAGERERRGSGEERGEGAEDAFDERLGARVLGVEGGGEK